MINKLSVINKTKKHFRIFITKQQPYFPINYILIVITVICESLWTGSDVLCHKLFTFKSFPLKPLNQIKPILAGMVRG